MWGRPVLILLLIAIICGFGVKEYHKSLGIWEENRFNMIIVSRESNQIYFLTYDPIEEKTIVINFPPNLTIDSRSVGEYSVGSLYQLGAYENKGAEFAKQKVQGFMKTPISGYLAGEGNIGNMLWRNIWSKKRESNLSRLDSWYLWSVFGKHTVNYMGEDELIRAGVIRLRDDEDKYDYSSERLEQYLGTRLFDWKVGKEGATVAIVNMSGIDGMGTDIGRFLTNMGLDVIAIRSGDNVIEKTKILVDPNNTRDIALQSLNKVFDFQDAEESTKPKDFRSDIVIEVGRDALSLF